MQPEWCFIFAYTVLRSIPNKLGGVVVLVLSIQILMMMTFNNKSKMMGFKFYPVNQISFWIMVSVGILNRSTSNWSSADPNWSSINCNLLHLFSLVPSLLKLWEFLLPKEK